MDNIKDLRKLFYLIIMFLKMWYTPLDRKRNEDLLKSSVLAPNLSVAS